MTKPSWKLTLNEQEIILTLTCRTGTCSKCQKMKTLHLICEKPIWIGVIPSYETKFFCWTCALAKLYELEVGDYQLANKQEIINEIRNKLTEHESRN